MSFITKRERVFNDFELFELPARNEGKLKAYGSCTDARAWSHFCSDKTEHLVDIIKRNNDRCTPKYVPTKVIVDTLMVTKNAEIGRLKRRINQFEQMLAAYDQLDLSCTQKCEIAKAHEAIRAANKDLDEICLDLDLSSFTEGVESEAFQTGKSRGDESEMSRGDELCCDIMCDWSTTSERKSESKSVQIAKPNLYDATTNAVDSRIEEMQEVIITKDAKLNAMQNTIAVMENDVCEPYCIYAHIYTALEKIFGILCQNEKYKQYLDLLVSGKDTRNIDITGKILFKVKVLEKFCVALLAPCSQENYIPAQECSCYHTEIVASVETTFALTSAESKPVSTLDSKRAQLVADIMEHDEMKEILSKTSKDSTEKNYEDPIDDICGIDTCSIETENLQRLKKLQNNYEELLTCYENVKHDRNCLQLRCGQYNQLEEELERLRSQSREYNLLRNEKEYYKKRSEDLDKLQEKYLVLLEETSNIETKMKAESEINYVKCKTIDGLRSENIELERKLNEAAIAFEKEKNSLQCKLKETECKVMCHEQQIKSLTAQIDRLLEQDQGKSLEDTPNSLLLMDEIASLKEQTKNLKDLLFCSEDEKRSIQEQFNNRLELINDLKLKIEDWKSEYEKTVNRNEYLEKYAENATNEIAKFHKDNENLTQDLIEKTAAVENLLNVINNKSQEINKLLNDLEKKKDENKELNKQLHDIRSMYNQSILSLENAKKEVVNSLHLAKKESEELFDKIKEYDNILHEQENISKLLEKETKENDKLNNLLIDSINKNKILQKELDDKDNINARLLKEIQNLRNFSDNATSDINYWRDEKTECEKALNISRKESKILEIKLSQLECKANELNDLRQAHDKVMKENLELQESLFKKNTELESAIISIQLSKRESEELLDKVSQSKIVKNELKRLNEDYQKVIQEKQELQNKLIQNGTEIDRLLKSVNAIREDNKSLSYKVQTIPALEEEIENLTKIFNEGLKEKLLLQTQLDEKTEEISKLCNILEIKIQENNSLSNQIATLYINNTAAQNNIQTLEEEKIHAYQTLESIKNERALLIDKIKHYEQLEIEFDNLKRIHELVQFEKNRLEKEFESKLSDMSRIEKENRELNRQSGNLLTYNEDLEKALINTRNQLISSGETSKIPYEDLMNQVEEMKNEKIRCRDKIRDLQDQLDEYENNVSNLSLDLSDRDARIAILENHINKLEDEVQQLHQTLDTIVNTTEELQENNHKTIEEVRLKAEDLCSRATHNMKSELVKLKKSCDSLEEQLSFTILKTEESLKEKNNIASNLAQLQKEREIIASELKHLEMTILGDTDITPQNCTVNEIMISIEKIRKSLDSRTSDNSTLESTLRKVQTSSQLLLSKADEAKRLVEKEKQKIIKEKEEAIQDRLKLEKQMMELKTTLEMQISSDKNIIKDLEAEALNQKLINKSTQSYIAELNQEIETLKNINRINQEKNDGLQDEIKVLREEKLEVIKTINERNTIIEDKILEITKLQKKLEEIKSKVSQNVGIQVYLSDYKSILTQTEDIMNYSSEITVKHEETELVHILEKDNKIAQKRNLSNTTKQIKEIKDFNNYRESMSNEVQILNATVEPTFDYVKNYYLSYKVKRLSPGPLEQHSISSEEDNELVTDNMKSYLNIPEIKRDYDSNTKRPVTDPNLQHSLTADFKQTSSLYLEASIETNLLPQKVQRSDQISDTEFSYDTFKTKSNNNLPYTNRNNSSSQNFSTDKEIFFIFKDSISNYSDQPNNISDSIKSNKKETFFNIGKNEVIVESMAIQDPVNNSKFQKNSSQRKYDISQDNITFENRWKVDTTNSNEKESHKTTLEIKMPLLGLESSSMPTTYEDDKKSSDSYTLQIYSGSNNEYDSRGNKIDDIYQNSLPRRSSSTASLTNERKEYLDSNYLLASDEEKLRRKISKNNNKYSTSERNKMLVQSSNSRFDNEPEISTTTNTQISSDIDFGRPVNNGSYHKLSRVGAEVLLVETCSHDSKYNIQENNKQSNFGLDYILDVVKGNNDFDGQKTYQITKSVRGSFSDEKLFNRKGEAKNKPKSPFNINSNENSSRNSSERRSKSLVEKGVLAKVDSSEDYEKKINNLTKALIVIEKQYKKKIEGIQLQYDCNIKSIINEHNEGVKNLQSLHEQTLQDILKVHENEVENLRSMSIEAMRKAEKMEIENKSLKHKVYEISTSSLDQEPVRILTPKSRRRKSASRDSKTLTKTHVEAFDVKPRTRSHGPCTCSLGVNISDTIRNIFEQVDIDHRQLAEQAYLKYIAKKILSVNVEALDAQELSFLHLKVCRTWKLKLNNEEALKKKIDSLESQLIHKQHHAQQHIAELDRKVAEERRRLQAVREAVCRSSSRSRGASPVDQVRCISPAPTKELADKDVSCNCDKEFGVCMVRERRSAGDLLPTGSRPAAQRPKRKSDSNKAILAKLDVEERRERRPQDEAPTRLRRAHDRIPSRPHKK